MSSVRIYDDLLFPEKKSSRNNASIKSINESNGIETNDNHVRVPLGWALISLLGPSGPKKGVKRLPIGVTSLS